MAETKINLAGYRALQAIFPTVQPVSYAITKRNGQNAQRTIFARFKIDGLCKIWLMHFRHRHHGYNVRGSV
jgi:hypothetical protein